MEKQSKQASVAKKQAKDGGFGPSIFKKEQKMEEKRDMQARKGIMNVR